MRSIVVAGLVCALTAIAAPAQITVGGGGSPQGIPAGATIWSGTVAPPSTVGANGDYYLNTVTYCLYGPKATGAWPTSCTSSVSQLGYIAENVGNKGTASGYAPLDANALLPAANLPPIGAINGTSVPSNSASDQTILTTGPAVAGWTTLPACPDTGGNHLNYSLVTHGFLCGDTGGTVGSVAFNGVGSGNNFNALVVSGTLAYTGGGLINANQLGGVSLSSLPTGLLKITTGTGVPSGAALSDVTATLGFTPENSANKGVASGYAPLDGAARIPASQMPILAGDLRNTGLSATVVGLQSRAVASAAPADGQVLTWSASGSTWGPVTPAGTGSGLVNPGGTPAANSILVADGANGDRWSTDTVSLTDGSLSTYHDPAATGHNVFFGNGAGNRTMSPGGGSAGLASFNTGLGYQALAGLTTGNQNVGIGELALTANTTGQQNVALGNLAMVANTTGSYNTAVGENALGNNTTGYDNFAFGLRALFQNTTGYNNAAFGIDSVGINTTGYRNSGFGTDSCAWNVTGYENSCMGMNTLWSLTTGYDNAATGFNAMFGATSGHYLTGLGAYADLYYPNTSTGVTLTPTSATSNLSVGWYWYKVSYVLNGQETALSNNSYLGVLTDSAHKEITLAGIPTYSGPFAASARKIYRTAVCPVTLCTVITANQAPRHWYYVSTINDNTSTNYVDTAADASLGPEESSTPSKSIALGAYATVYGSYQMTVGSDASPIQQIWLGNGMVTATAPAGVLVSSSGASGTNTAGQDHIIAGGPGTGSANGGNLIFGTVPGGASGSTWNSLVNRWKIDSATGNLVSLSTGGIAGVTGVVDFSGGAHTLPAKAGLGASKPPTCTVGEQYFATDAAAGQNLFGCTAANTWTLEAGAGGGGGAVSSIFGRTGAIAAQTGDYTFAQIGGTLPDGALPGDAVTTGALGNATLTADLASLTTTGAVTSGGAVTAAGNVYANSGSNAAGCLHLSDANGVHDTGICAPSSGFNGQFNLWTGGGSSGQVAITDGSLNLLWANLGGIAGTLAAAQMPVLTGDVGNSGLATTVTGLQGRPAASTAPTDQQYLGWSASAAKWQPISLPATLSATGGVVYNPAGAGNTQIVIKNSSSQAGNGAGSILWQNNAGATMSFINWDGGYAEGDGTNYKISLDTSTETLSSDSVIAWHSVNNAFSGAADTGLAREAAGGILKVTNGAAGYGILDAGGLEINGTAVATTLAGDATGAIGANTVVKIQNRAIASTAPADGQSLAWSAANSQWQPTTISAGGGAVTSVFGRTGAVVSQSGDYTATQVTNALSSTQTYASPAWLTAVTFGGTTLNSTGGTIYNNAGSGNTQIVIKNSASQASNGAGSILWQNNAGSNIAFINWDGGYATGDGTNYKISLDTETVSLSSDALMVWHNVNSVFSGSADVGLERSAAGVLKVTAGASGYGGIDSGGYSASGAAGVTATTCTQWTNGLCTHN